MKRLLLTVVLLALLAPTGAHAAVPTIYVLNDSTDTTDQEITNALPAFQAAVSNDFAPYWSDAKLVFADEAPPKAWTVTVTNTLECFFCLGYHDVHKHVPYAKVLAGDGWQVTFTHEVFELIGNPYIDQAVLVAGRWWAMETADPVEANELAYPRPGADGTPVQISDFILPAWFRARSTGPWDFTHATHRARQILSDGYQLYWNAKKRTWSSWFVGREARGDAREKQHRWAHHRLH